MSSITAVVFPDRVKLTPEIPYETLESLIPAAKNYDKLYFCHTCKIPPSMLQLP